jgi:hypothetical protein
MSLPKPEFHVRVSDNASYTLRTLAAIDGRSLNDVASEILERELAKRYDQMVVVGQRLLADGRIR